MLCKGVDYMLNIETKELKISVKLKRKIETIGRFTNTTPIINNGSIKNIAGTNVAYVIKLTLKYQKIKKMYIQKLLDIYMTTKLLVKKHLIELQVGIMI